jgi:hypothetical protein
VFSEAPKRRPVFAARTGICWNTDRIRDKISGLMHFSIGENRYPFSPEKADAGR